MNFEQSLNRLQEITVQLGKGNLDLNEALKLFEEGSGLVRACNTALDVAEQKVTVLQGEKEEVFDE